MQQKIERMLTLPTSLLSDKLKNDLSNNEKTNKLGITVYAYESGYLISCHITESTKLHPSIVPWIEMARKQNIQWLRFNDQINFDENTYQMPFDLSKYTNQKYCKFHNIEDNDTGSSDIFDHPSYKHICTKDVTDRLLSRPTIQCKRCMMSQNIEIV